jgi:hypothetical protein
MNLISSQGHRATGALVGRGTGDALGAGFELGGSIVVRDAPGAGCKSEG